VVGRARRSGKSQPVGVLTKTFQILDLLRGSLEPLNLTQISAQSGINKSTALRLLAHLEAAQYVRRDARGQYSVGNELSPVRGASTLHQTLRRLARPHLWDLWRATQESVNLAVLDGAEVVYLDCLEATHEFRLVAHIGMRAALYRTALGKAILAFLPDARREAVVNSLCFEAFTPNTITSVEPLNEELRITRERGYAIDNEESHLGLRCLAAPVFASQREAVAAISVSAPIGRLTSANMGAFAAALRQAAQGLSDRIASSRIG
jgi:DNA-binding IclR family transcriptional regulator